MTDRRTFMKLAAGVAGGVMLPSWAASGAAEMAPRTLRVSTFKGQPYYVAAYFLKEVAPEGVTIDLVETATSSEAVDALLTGDTDAAYLGSITTILAVARDRPVSAVASVGRKGTRILARTDSGIKTIKDLAGKNIGISKSTGQDLILRELMLKAGMNPQKDANYILLPTNAHIEAFLTGTVDAVAASEPFGSFLLNTGKAVDLAPEPDLYTTPVGAVGNVLALRNEMIAKDPDLAQSIVILHAKATVAAREHPEEMLDVLVNASRQKPDIIKPAMKNTELTYNIDEAYLTQAGVLEKRLIENGYLDRPVDLKTVFDLRFLPKARETVGKVY